MLFILGYLLATYDFYEVWKKRLDIMYHLCNVETNIEGGSILPTGLAGPQI